MNGFVKSTAWALTGSMVLGMMPGDDDSAFRDIRRVGFAVAMSSTSSLGPTSPGGGGIVQNTYTGEEIPLTVKKWSRIIFTDPSSGSNAST